MSESKLAGRYAFRGELGRGASGRVLLVADEADGGVLRALKVVPPAEAERLAWEFELLAGVAHPNVARVHELLRLEDAMPAPFQLSAGAAALVEERVEGDRADRRQELVAPEERQAWALHVLEQIARGLAALHARGFMHGDVKPANVVVDDERRAVLVDLGLAQAPGLRAGAGGTPGFMAPEAFEGERSVATDLYAVGATAFVLLGGELAAAGSASRSLGEALRLSFERPARASDLPASTPPALRRLVQSLLATDPLERPASARELASRFADLRGAESLAGGDDAPTDAERALAVLHQPLRGRDDELARLSAVMQQGAIVAVVGPAASGATRLVREAARTFQRGRVASDERAPTVVRCSGALPGESLRHDAIVIVEDGDAVSFADAEAFVDSAAVTGHRAFVVLEGRVDRPHGDATVHLEPVPDATLAAILEDTLGASASASLVAAAREASGGLPGRLCRLLSAGLAEGAQVARPASLRDLASRAPSALTLTGDARALAERLAVSGGLLAVEELPETPRGAHALRAAGLAWVAPDGRLALRADVVASVRAELSEGHRAARGRELLDHVRSRRARGFVLAAAGRGEEARPQLLAAIAELREAGDPEAAARLAEAAAHAVVGEPLFALARADALRACGRYALAHAAVAAASTSSARLLRAQLERHLGVEEPLELAELDPEDARRALALSARRALDRGDLEEAKALTTELLSGPRDGATVSARVVRALALLYRGDVDGAAREAAEGASEAASSGAALDEARALSVRGSADMLRGRLTEAARHHARSFELADAVGERHASATFLVNVGLVRLELGEPGAAVFALREGARRLSTLGRERELARALYNLANAAFLVGDDDVARSAARRAAEAADKTGDASAQTYALVVLAELAARSGELTDAAARFVEATSLAERTSEAVRVTARARAAVLAAATGRVGDAEALLEGLGVAPADAHGATELGVARARLSLAQGDAAAGLARSIEAAAHAERHGGWETRLRANLGLAAAAEAARDKEQGVRALAAARTLLDIAGATLLPAGRARLRALPAYRRALAMAPSSMSPGALISESRWRRLVAVARRLTAERRVGRLYEELLEAAVDLCGAERGMVVLRAPDGSLRVRVARGIERGALAADGASFSRSVVRRAMELGRAVTTVDALVDERLEGAASVHALALRSALALPLRQGVDIVGALYLDDRLRPAAFGDDDVALLSDLVALGAIALEGAERLRAERRATRRLRVLQRRLSRTVETQAIELATLRDAAADGEGGIVAASSAMRGVLDMALRVAGSDVSLLVRGESGTGKEVIARAIHHASARRERPFVSENVSAIPDGLLESELFGHVRGAFTGADRGRLGLFAAADGGTLLLDEVGEMSAAMQAKLLRVVQEGEVRPVGGERIRKVDVRLIAATHRDLEAMVRSGEFREDLYYRLAVVTLEVPPLRRRRQDISGLVGRFLTRYGEGRELRITEEALACLVAFDWPGNVRQLENEIQRALVVADDVIRETHLSEAVRGAPPARGEESLGLKSQVAELERRLISAALERHGGNQTRSAKELGVSRYGLQKMLKRLGLR